MKTSPKRTLIVGDIHGKLSLLNRLLAEAGYNPVEDRLIFIGDLVDRGDESKGVVDRAIDLKRQSPNRVVVIRGNHEAMMLEALAEPESDRAELWYYNGGVETIQSYIDENGNLDVPESHWDFLASLPTWYEDDHAIYVHASLAEDEEGGFDHPANTPESPELYWSRNRRFFNEYKGKTVVIGHTITGMIFGEREKVWMRDDSIICVDTGAYLTGVLSAVELPSRKVFSVSESTGSEADHMAQILRKLSL